MKKASFLLASLLIFFACKKNEPEPTPDPVPADTVAPVLTLNGKAIDTAQVLSTYTDPGATASDNKDGNISASIVVKGTVNTGIPGTYTLSYHVSDLAGNAATPLTRTVQVRANNAMLSSGIYLVACTSTTQNPGEDPPVSASSNYTSQLSLSGQTGTVITLSALNIGPMTGPTNNFGVNSHTFSIQGSPVNAPAQTFAYATGTVGASKQSFTIDTKYYQTMYPNKFYEARNVFTRQ